MDKPVHKKGISMMRGDRRQLPILATANDGMCADKAHAALSLTRNSSLAVLSVYVGRSARAIGSFPYWRYP